MRQVRAIHQVVGKSSPGNSVANFALALQDGLRQWGYESTIFANEVEKALGNRVRPLHKFRPRSDELLILHYARANVVTEWVQELDIPLIFCYHNVTPAQFFTGVGNAQTEASQKGLAQLGLFQSRTLLALTFSNFSANDLYTAGYEHVQILPLLLPQTLQSVTPDASVLRNTSTGPNLLNVGRIAPNKRCEDCIKILHQYRQIEPNARLFIVGAHRYARPYVGWLYDFVQRLGLVDAVIFTGQVSDEALAAYYQTAAAFIMMSEHEGFGIPLVESMRFDVPVIAYDSTAVPETMGGAGVLIKQKRFDVIAELLHLIHTNADLRTNIIEHQRERVKTLNPNIVWAEYQTQIENVIEHIARM